MKNLLKKFLTFILILSTLSFSCSNVIAATTDLSENSSGFYIASSDVPNNYIQFVTAILPTMLNNRIINDNSLDPQVSTSLNDYYVGTPFQMKKEDNSVMEAYYFPIICDNNIIYIFMSYPSTNPRTGSYEALYGCTGYLTNALASELNILKTEISTSEESPIEIQRNLEDVNYKINGKNEQLVNSVSGKESISDKEVTTETVNDIAQLPSLRTRNIEKPTNIMEPVLALSDIINSGASTRAPGWNFFNGIDISETQSTLPWCGAYCATAIIRSQTNHRVYAGNLMAVCYPNETMSERIEHGTKIPHDYITYAESLGMTKLAYRDYQLSPSSIYSLMIDANRVQTSWEMQYSDGRFYSRHAQVICGASSVADPMVGEMIFYEMWNPWYNRTISYLESSVKDYLNLSGYYSVWDQSIYNYIY